MIALGTLCSRDSWLAAGATGAAGFAILFASGFSGYLAAAANGALLHFVLSTNVPAPTAAIPDRLLGWGLAVGVAKAAALFLWLARRRADLRRAAVTSTPPPSCAMGRAFLDTLGCAQRPAVAGHRELTLII